MSPIAICGNIECKKELHASDLTALMSLEIAHHLNSAITLNGIEDHLTRTVRHPCKDFQIRDDLDRYLGFHVFASGILEEGYIKVRDDRETSD